MNITINIYLKSSPIVRKILAMKGITTAATPAMIESIIQHEIFIIGTEGFFHDNGGNLIYYPPHEITKIEVIT